MKWLWNIVFTFFSNLIALLLAGTFIAGFTITTNLTDLMIAAATFTLINWLIRPIVKALLSPIVFLTFGLFILVINAGMLYLLDILSTNVTISTPQALIYGTLLITAVNLVLHFSAKRLS
ncbi:MAG: phage holin family protein [Patescibacteria group bacterium]|nr:phage holin family protein [Patescibacteria group bacterium]